jgi:NAD(P)H dehydrogenase (quinone)
MTITIAITGATGQLRRLIVGNLKAKVPTDTIVVHPFDYSKPETLGSALDGADTLMLVSSSEVGQRAVQHRNVIEAAKAAGVKRIVYISLLNADTSPLNLNSPQRSARIIPQKGAGSIPAISIAWHPVNDPIASFFRN